MSINGKTKILLYLIFIFELSATAIFSQSLVFSPLTIKEGLPHNSVHAVCQDQSGFMWFGTQGGLVRYDGYNFKTFSHVKSKEGEEILIRSVHCILIDSKGVMWIGTDSDGLVTYNLHTGVWSQFISYEIIKARINAVFEDKRSRLLIGTMGNGCFLLKSTGELEEHYSVESNTLGNNNVFSFAQTDDQRIWIAAAGKGIYYLDTNTKQLQSLHNVSSPAEDLSSFRKCLYVHKNNSLWIGTEGDGLYILDVAQKSFLHFKKGTKNDIPVNSISDIQPLANGQIYLSSDGGGLFECNASADNFSFHPVFNTSTASLNTKNLLNLFVDKEQKLWIATFNGGLNIGKQNKKRFHNLKEWSGQDFDLSNRSVLDICESSSGKVYFATDGGGVNVWNNDSKLWSRIKPKGKAEGYLAKAVVKSLLEDSKGNIWLGYFGGGLDCYNPQTASLQHYAFEVNNPQGLSGEIIWSLKEDKNGDICVGTLDGGLNIFHPATNKFSRYLHQEDNANSLLDNRIFTLLVEEDTNIWIGTQNNGLDYFDRIQNKFFHYIKKEEKGALSANDIRCLFKDAKGRLWVGTESGGLNLLLDGDKFKSYNRSSGLLSNTVMSVVEDQEGILWISSFQGISRFDPEKETFVNYDFHVPDKANQFNQCSSIKFKDGTIGFGGINGVSFFQPLNVLENSVESEVRLSDFKLFNTSVVPFDGSNILKESLDEVEEIHLSYDQDLFSIEFSALQYDNPLDVSYAYLMEGLDDQWTIVERGSRLVTYNSLPPGSYIFNVKATNSNGLWSNKVTKLKIFVHPPFYKTWWFRLLLLAFFVLIAGAAARYYSKRREEQWKITLVEREKTILSLQNEKLAAENETKTTELMSKAIQMGHKIEVMSSLKDGLSELRTGQTDAHLKKIRVLENIVNMELQNEDSWTQLNLYFDQVNHHFTEKLLKTYPHLTQNDLRICILIKLNLSIKEMASLLNVSVPGIEKSKYRLKKRLFLSSEDDLTEFLRTFE
ncbi:MAG: two-component regulator propeller domain-containing protein [Saprospiraceae bacterium]